MILALSIVSAVLLVLVTLLLVHFSYMDGAKEGARAFAKEIEMAMENLTPEQREAVSRALYKHVSQGRKIS